MNQTLKRLGYSVRKIVVVIQYLVIIVMKYIRYKPYGKHISVYSFHIHITIATLKKMLFRESAFVKIIFRR